VHSVSFFICLVFRSASLNDAASCDLSFWFFNHINILVYIFTHMYSCMYADWFVCSYIFVLFFLLTADDCAAIKSKTVLQSSCDVVYLRFNCSILYRPLLFIAVTAKHLYYVWTNAPLRKFPVTLVLSKPQINSKKILI